MRRLRVATFNVAFDRPAAGVLNRQLAGGAHPQIGRVAEIIGRVRPDVLLLCEFDHDGEGLDRCGVDDFRRRFLARAWHGSEPIDYPHAWLIPTNTGQPLPFDLDGDGVITPPADCYGFGDFHGQYGMLLLSRFPIEVGAARTFRRFPWQAMPGARLPASLPEVVRQGLRLSSKNHVDVPICIDGQRLHLLAMHPTPPVFGPLNRDRNHDELRLFYDYLTGADYLRDDDGKAGGLAPGVPFVLLGDFNADPLDGEGERAMIQALLAHPRIHPACRGGVGLPRSRGGAAFTPRGVMGGEAACWTHIRPLRLDYVLPSRECQLLASGVYWAAPGEPLRYLFANEQGAQGKEVSSDHRLVWVDIGLDHPC